MANTNQEAIQFCDRKLRVGSDAFLDAYDTAKALVLAWTSENIASLIPNDNVVIQDAASPASGTPDGRPPITDGNVNVTIANAQAFISFCEANNNLILNQFTATGSNNSRSAI